jgi:hypothetical protein
MTTLDLDAKRAARDEARNYHHTVRFGGEPFIFPARLPLEFLDRMSAGTPRAAFAVLFGENPDTTPPGGEVTARFFSHRPDDGDLEAISSGLYSTSLGESPASPTSSTNGGRPSKATGRRTTRGGTSPSIATEQINSGSGSS